jgi:hypothetical protein
MVIRGGIPQAIITIITKNVKSDNINQCISGITTKFRKYLSTIWKERCDRFIQWEKMNHIKRKDKKQWNNTKNINTQDTVKDRYPEIVNKYMGEYTNLLEGVEKMFTISININGYGNALTR